jgi:regulator of protease activity HflC (stomatin/prohibitin superfamily)
VDYEPFTLNSKDGSQFTVDPTILIQLEKGEGPAVFRKYRKQLNDVLLSTIYTYVKDAYRIELNKYTADELISNRNKFESDVQAHLDTILAAEHFRLSQVTSGLQYPSSLVEAINMKNKVVQDKQRADNEVMLAKAQAEKLLVSARAEAEANRLRTTALTPAVLEQMWIEKWDGKLPVYGQVPTMFKDISK